jgi:hypothetical protein
MIFIRTTRAIGTRPSHMHFIITKPARSTKGQFLAKKKKTKGQLTPHITTSKYFLSVLGYGDVMKMAVFFLQDQHWKFKFHRDVSKTEFPGIQKYEIIHEHW